MLCTCLVLLLYVLSFCVDVELCSCLFVCLLLALVCLSKDVCVVLVVCCRFGLIVVLGLFFCVVGFCWLCVCVVCDCRFVLMFVFWGGIVLIVLFDCFIYLFMYLFFFWGGVFPFGRGPYLFLLLCSLVLHVVHCFVGSCLALFFLLVLLF